MGREIARVMDPYSANWLERPNRNVEERPEQVLRNMNHFWCQKHHIKLSKRTYF